MSAERPETSPLSREVLDLLGHLLAADDPVAAALRAQVPHARMSPDCRCGCASVALHVDPAAAAPAAVPESPYSSAQVETPAGEPEGGLLLFVSGGYLSSLEIYFYDEPHSRWPSLDQLRPD